MNHALDLTFELEHNKKRLSYYLRLKEKAGSASAPVLDKWIDIYSGRLKKAERGVEKLGLKTRLQNPEHSAAQRA